MYIYVGVCVYIFGNKSFVRRRPDGSTNPSEKAIMYIPLEQQQQI
jgi:hypothetical protein